MGVVFIKLIINTCINANKYKIITIYVVTFKGLRFDKSVKIRFETYKLFDSCV